MSKCKEGKKMEQMLSKKQKDLADVIKKSKDIVRFTADSEIYNWRI